MAQEKPTSKDTPALLPGGVTQAQIDAWKAEHGDVWQIAVDKDKTSKEKYYGYVHKPDRPTVELAMEHYAKSKVVRAGEIILNNCWLGGHKEIQTDEMVSLAAAMQVAELVDIKAAEIKKL